ncbi:MAG: hypothetical protein P1U39_02230 [Legionellaceae bacterium]|nr:hypothetical protein [Legionellaceae bacterium]
MSIEDRIQEKLGIDLVIFDLFDETQIQEQLEDVLREKALDHLLSSPAPKAKFFRSNFHVDHHVSREEYFAEMRQPGAWATTDEAIALAEMLDINLDVNMIDYEFNQDGTDVIEIVRHQALYTTSTPDAPTITLNNRENEHWFINDKTKSLGDCLFDAMAQALQQLVKPALVREHTNGSPLSDATDTESIESVDHAQLELLKAKIGSEAIAHVIDDMQQTPLAEFEAVQRVSQALINVMDTELVNLDEEFKFLLQTADSIDVMNTIIDDMRQSLQKNSLTRLDILNADRGIPREADYKMLKQQIMHAPNLCAAEKILGDLNRRLLGEAPQLDTPSDDDDNTPSPGI